MLLRSSDYIIIFLCKSSTPLSGFSNILCRKKRQLKCYIVCTDKYVHIQYKQHNLRGRFFITNSVLSMLTTNTCIRNNDKANNYPKHINDTNYASTEAWLSCLLRLLVRNRTGRPSQPTASMWQTDRQSHVRTQRRSKLLIPVQTVLPVLTSIQRL